MIRAKNNKQAPSSFTVTVSFTNREDVVYNAADKEDAKRFKNAYRKGKILMPSGSIVRTVKITPNY